MWQAALSNLRRSLGFEVYLRFLNRFIANVSIVRYRG